MTPPLKLRFAVGGDLVGEAPDPALADTGIAAGTYGDATHVPVLTLNTQGRVTGVTLVAISGGGGGSSAGADYLLFKSGLVI